MKDIFRRKTHLEKLTTQYATLIKRSFEKALFNKEESRALQQKARKIRQEIKQLSYSYADN